MYKNVNDFKEAIDNIRPVASFRESWNMEVLPTHDELREYCAGIATGMPTTAPVESDFSLISVVKDEYSSCITDFTSEGCLHSIQFEELLKLLNNLMNSFQ